MALQINDPAFKEASKQTFVPGAIGPVEEPAVTIEPLVIDDPVFAEASKQRIDTEIAGDVSAQTETLAPQEDIDLVAPERRQLTEQEIFEAAQREIEVQSDTDIPEVQQFVGQLQQNIQDPSALAEILQVDIISPLSDEGVVAGQDVGGGGVVDSGATGGVSGAFGPQEAPKQRFGSVLPDFDENEEPTNILAMKKAMGTEIELSPLAQDASEKLPVTGTPEVDEMSTEFADDIADRTASVVSNFIQGATGIDPGLITPERREALEERSSKFNLNDIPGFQNVVNFVERKLSGGSTLLPSQLAERRFEISTADVTDSLAQVGGALALFERTMASMGGAKAGSLADKGRRLFGTGFYTSAITNANARIQEAALTDKKLDPVGVAKESFEVGLKSGAHLLTFVGTHMVAKGAVKGVTPAQFVKQVEAVPGLAKTLDVAGVVGIGTSLSTITQLIEGDFDPRRALEEGASAGMFVWMGGLNKPKNIKAKQLADLANKRWMDLWQKSKKAGLSKAEMNELQFLEAGKNDPKFLSFIYDVALTGKEALKESAEALKRGEVGLSTRKPTPEEAAKVKKAEAEKAAVGEKAEPKKPAPKGGFAIDEVVKATDRGNFGKIVEFTDKGAKVRFVNKETGRSSTVNMSLEQIEKTKKTQDLTPEEREKVELAQRLQREKQRGQLFEDKGEEREAIIEEQRTPEQIIDIMFESKPPTPTPKELGEGKEVKQVFKVDKFNLTKEGNDLIQKSFEKAGLERRRVKHNEQTVAEAEKLDDDVILAKLPDVLDGKTNLSDAEVLRMSNLSNNLANAIGELSKQAKDNPNLYIEIEDMLDNLERATVLQVRAGTAHGRAIQIMRQQASFTLEPSFWLRQAAKKIGNDRLPGDTVQKINDFIAKGDRDGLAQFVANLGETLWSERILTLYKAGLLTGIPKTDAKNMGSNTLIKVFDDLTDLGPGNIFDSIIGSMTGLRTVDFTLENAFNSWSQFGKGASEGWELLRTGVDKTNYAGNKIEFKKSFDRFSKNPVERAAAHYTDFIFGRLEAEDKPFKAMAFGKSLWERARIDGKKAGLKDRALDQFIAKKMANPTAEMMRLAQHDALLMTFQAENTLNDAWRGFIGGAEGLAKLTKADETRMGRELAAAYRASWEFVNPFNKVGTNLILVATEFSPLGFGKAVLDAVGPVKGKQFTKKERAIVRQRRVVKDLSRATVGSAISFAILNMIKDSKDEDDPEITLRTLSEFKERRLKQRAGEQEGSFSYTTKEGKRRNISFSGVDPIPSFFLSAGIMKKIADGEIGYKEGILTFVQQKYVNESYFTGIKDMLDALTPGDTGEEKMDRFIQNTAAGFVPTIVYQFSKLSDDTFRDVDSIPSAILARIPILRKQLPPRIDAFGNEVKYKNDNVTKALNIFLNPFAVSTVEIGDIDKELKRLVDAGFDSSRVLPSETFTRIQINGRNSFLRLNAKERNLVQTQRGKNVFTGLTNIMKSDDYKEAEDERKVSMISSHYTRAWTETKKTIVKEIAEQKVQQKQKSEKQTKDLRLFIKKQRDKIDKEKKRDAAKLAREEARAVREEETAERKRIREAIPRRTPRPKSAAKRTRRGATPTTKPKTERELILERRRKRLENRQ